MVDGCQAVDCKRRLEETHDAVFKDEIGGCRFDISWLKRNIIGRKAAWTALSFILVVIGVPAYISMANIWAGNKVDKDTLVRFGKTQEMIVKSVSINDIRIARLEERFGYLDMSLKDLKAQQAISTKEILDAIRKNP